MSKIVQLCMLVAAAIFANAVQAEKPNIIFILTDDQGYGDLGRHGHPLLKTPHTNRLHDESVRFDRHHGSDQLRLPHSIETAAA